MKRLLWSQQKKGFLKNLLKTFGIFGAIFLVSLLGFLARLSYSPLDLEPLKSVLEKSFSSLSPESQMRFSHLQLSWSRKDYRFQIEAEHIKVENKKKIQALIPKLKIRFSVLQFLIGQRIPHTIELISPTFWVSGAAEIEAFSTHSVLETWLQELVTTLTNRSPRFGLGDDFKKVRIQNADLNFSLRTAKNVLPKTWHVQHLTLDLEKIGTSLLGSLSGSIEHTSTLQPSFQAKFTYDPDHHHVGTHVIASHIALGFCRDLATSFFQKEKDTNLSGEKDLYFSGSMDCVYDLVHGFQKATIDLKSSKGSFVLPPYFPHSIPMDELSLQASLKKGQVIGYRVGVMADQTKSYIEGIMEWHPGEKKLEIQGTGQAIHVPFQNLNLYWPPHVGTVTRNWMIKNIPQGLSPKATIKFSGDLTLTDLLHPHWEVKQLEGDIAFTKASLDYLEGMPLAVGIDGQAHYTLEAMALKITKASAKGSPLKVTQGEIHIADLHKDNQNIAIDLTIHGPLEKALSFIDHPPLSFVKKLGLNLKNPQGQTQTQARLVFPLERTVTLDQVKLQVTSQVTQSKFSYSILNQDILFQDGKFRLVINNEKLEMKGGGHASNHKIDLDWEKFFDPHSKRPSLLKIHSVLTSPLLNRFRESGQVPLLTGIVIKEACPLSVIYEMYPEKKARLKGEIDLTPASLTVWGFKKPSYTFGKVTFVGYFKDDSSLALEEFSAFSPGGLDLQLKAQFLEDASGISLKQLTLLKGKVGKTNIRGHLVRKQISSQQKNPHVSPASSSKQFFSFAGQSPYRLDITGSSLDLKPFLEAFSLTQDQKWGLNVEGHLQVQKVYLEHGQIFSNNHLTFTYEDEKIKTLRYHASLEALQKTTEKKSGRLSMQIFPVISKGSHRKLVIHTENAGKFLQAFTTLDHLKSGQLTFIALHDDQQPTNPWEGRLWIKNFYLEKAPLLSRILALAFPTGFVHFFSKQGLPFVELKLKFKAFPEKILLSQGRAFGSSLGFSLKGHINQKTQEVNLQGTLIPVYFLNTLLSNIPLLGKVLSGGKGEGLFGVSYRISGTRLKPIISVNPLSAFAPGIFRHIFSPDSDPEDDTPPKN